MTKKAKTKAKFYNPPNVLRQKCGYGGIDPALLEKSDAFIAQNDVDFGPIAKKILERLDKGVKLVRDSKTAPLIDIKANGAMFKFGLLTEVADIALNFLENIDRLNPDAVEILEVNRRTLHVIIDNNLRGGGGAHGNALLKELTEACQRYYKKHNMNME